MNINLNDKKIKKIVYAIDDRSELDIIFENGEITSLNRRYLSAMKPDTFLSSMLDGSRKLGKAIIERNKKNGQAPTKKNDNKNIKGAISNLFTAKKLIEMDKDGTIDAIAKAHKQYVTDTTEGKEPTSYKDYLAKCEQESNNGEETLKRFVDGLDKMNVPVNVKSIIDEQWKPNKISWKDIEELRKYENKKCNRNCDECNEECYQKQTEDKCGMGEREESDTITESGNNAEKADKPQQPDFIKFEEPEDEQCKLLEYDADKIETWFSKIDKDKLRVLYKLGELGFYDLNPNERKVQCNDLIKKAMFEVYGERE